MSLSSFSLGDTVHILSSRSLTQPCGEPSPVPRAVAPAPPSVGPPQSQASCLQTHIRWLGCPGPCSKERWGGGGEAERSSEGSLLACLLTRERAGSFNQPPSALAIQSPHPPLPIAPSSALGPQPLASGGSSTQWYLSPEIVWATHCAITLWTLRA